jgi:polar amino acid transport system substrate-binding protein
MPIRISFANALGLLLLCLLARGAVAQSAPLTFATVDRPPFSEEQGGEFSGFSIDLMRAIGQQMGKDIAFTKVDRFPEMFTALESGRTDGAIANISITAGRELAMDFSHSIFASGLRIMVPDTSGNMGLLRTLLNRDILLFLLGAMAFLTLGGMAMWAFERRRQPYFDRTARDALFPSFWWALNLVVNGGFEERVPQSRPGRFFAVLLVVSSLFIVSIFVARITTAMTVEAISGSINSLSDLNGRSVATTAGSTSSAFLDEHAIPHSRTDRLAALLEGFEAGAYDAVVFDGPILAYYLLQHPRAGRLLPNVFKPENYGIALPTGSPLTEDINRALLALRESGRYDEIREAYFGTRN